METIRLLVDQHASAEAKIALFRSLFRGREDVYPRRFESRKTGKSGYAPACSNEWVRGICEKPRVKCAECPNRRFLSVNETVIRWHLSGQDDTGQPFVAGVYPMLLDETCLVLAIDFDKEGWGDDTLAFLETCHRLKVPAALERSRSGRGAHGVDLPLASLFVAAAQPIPADAEGAGRARSSSEAFLYCRLETLEGSRGRFRLNAELATQFDGRGRMEVDLLCADARLAVEVDGALHLGDAEAYRRDRRKDRLLQEHGYTVLRFLAEDLAKDLNTVLDTILRALANQTIAKRPGISG